MEDDYAIGLDLGTTFSCIGVYRNGGVEIIPNSYGEKITPSVVIFIDNEILVGEDTTDYLVKYYDNCLYQVKRLIGLDFSKKYYRDEIDKLPFKVNLPTSEHKQADIVIEVNKEIKTYSPTEISSLIIKKMVHNAENYLHKKIKKLVITVPAYFSENQKKLTSQAAEMLNLEVIKIINEPTAAALAYGFTKDQSKDKNILVFDLGGGTFDVSILSFESERNNIENTNTKNLSVLATSGDMHLGGEDFDNALVDYVIEKGNIQKELIRKNNQAMKRLKVACENTKKILSLSDKTTLRINNILDKTDINLVITKEEFEIICQPLFERLKIPLTTALSDAKKKMQSLNRTFSNDDIDEIILIGGSTRIPKVKKFVKDFFPNKIVNDSINPDEAVAYGATLQAEKILYNHDKVISNFHILDIAPFSLGIATQNNSVDKEIQKEGHEMSVIIQRGSFLPIEKTRNYETVENNQTEVLLQIYEGEKKFVKYNHLLKKTLITGLSPKPKGETKISVEFKIDVNGILYVKAVEESEENGKTIELTIKNDEISFSKEEMEKMKLKMIEITKDLKYKELDIDYSNLKDTLKKYKDAYNKCRDDEEDNKIIFLNNFNTALEEFIDGFDKNFDNETLLEKFYLYIKELFSSYLNKLKFDLDKSERKSIFDNIEKYIKIFINKSSGYLDNLIEMLSVLKKDQIYKKYKMNFINLIIFIMEQLNNCGKEYLKSNKEFSKYHSFMYFEQSLNYYNKYLTDVDEALIDKKNLDKFKNQKKICMDYKNDIESGAILLIEESIRNGRIFNDEGKYLPFLTGFTNKMNNILNYKPGQREEELVFILKEYEKILSSIHITNEPSEKEGICITNILKINDMLKKIDKNNKYLIYLSDRCDLIIDKFKIDRKKGWCQEFLKIKEKIDKLKTPDENYKELFQNVRRENSEIFDEIDRQFEENGKKIKFIEFILLKHPYKSYEKDKKERNFKIYNIDLLYFLSKKYQPENYMKGNKESELEHCINHEISSKISNLITSM